jgi:hypothetical protein
MIKDKYKTIYRGIIPVYHEDEDYCRIAIARLRRAIASGVKDDIDDALAKLTKYFDDLSETVNLISKRFKQISELLDEQLDSKEGD